MATDYKVGDKIVLFRRHQEAIIRYVGKTEFAPNIKNYGLELLGGALGDNDGTVNNIKYFKCGQNKGLFIFEKDIKFKIQAIKRNSKVLVPRPKSHTKIVATNIKKSCKKQKSVKKANTKNKNDKKYKKHMRRKTGPRDVGRNDNYKGIEDGDTAPKKKQSKQKSKKSLKKSLKKVAKNTKNVIKTDLTEKHQKQKQIVNENVNIMGVSAEVSDSDSYKSGYSGASGHSGYAENELELNEIGFVDGSEGNDGYSESEHDALTKKVMLMMKEKEKENKNVVELQSNLLVDVDGDAKSGDILNVEAMDDERIIKCAVIDDDFPEANTEDVKLVKFRSYAKRKSSVHDGVGIIVTKGGILKDIQNGVDIKYMDEEEGDIDGKTKNVNINTNAKDGTVTNNGCCVVL